MTTTHPASLLFISLEHAQFYYSPFMEFAPLLVSSTLTLSSSTSLLMLSFFFLTNGLFSFYLGHGFGPQDSAPGTLIQIYILLGNTT